MAVRYPSFFPNRVNMRVPSAMLAGQAVGHGEAYYNLGAPAAFDDDDIFVTELLGAAGNFTIGGASATSGVAILSAVRPTAIFGCCVSLSTTTTNHSGVTITVYGWDWLGQRVVETIAGPNNNTVTTKKALVRVDRVAAGAAIATNGVRAGWSNTFGLGLKGIALVTEIKNGAVAANAATFTAGLANGTAATANNADVRGTYLPSTVLPDGTNTFEIYYRADRTNLHGNAQYAG